MSLASLSLRTVVDAVADASSAKDLNAKRMVRGSEGSGAGGEVKSRPKLKKRRQKSLNEKQHSSEEGKREKTRSNTIYSMNSMFNTTGQPFFPLISCLLLCFSASLFLSCSSFLLLVLSTTAQRKLVLYSLFRD